MVGALVREIVGRVGNELFVIYGLGRILLIFFEFNIVWEERL